MGDVNNRANSGPRLLPRIFLLLFLFSYFNYSTCVHASYIRLDLSGNIVILSDAGKNVSLMGKSVFANGMDLGLLYAEVQQLQQAIVQPHEWIAEHNASLSSLEVMVTAQQQKIAHQQNIIEHQQETIPVQNAFLSSLQSIVTSQQHTIAQLQLTFTMVTGYTLPSLNSTYLNLSLTLFDTASNNSCFSYAIPDIQAGLSQLNKSFSSLSYFATEINQNVSILSTHTIPLSSLLSTLSMQEKSLSRVNELISQSCALGRSFGSNISIAMPLVQQCLSPYFVSL